MNNVHNILVGFEIYNLEGFQKLKDAYFSFEKKFRLLSTSSVYKKYLSPQKVDLNSSIFFVTLAETNFDELKTHQIISETSDKIRFLAYDSLVLMSPTLTLPDPALYKDIGILRCSAEIYGNYRHPILNKSLNEILSTVKSFEYIEFYSQGNELWKTI
jgi:hypothetical protein